MNNEDEERIYKLERELSHLNSKVERLSGIIINSFSREEIIPAIYRPVGKIE